MTTTNKLPVIDQHDRDGDIIGYATTAEEAATITRNSFLQSNPDEDEISKFDANNTVYWYSADTQDFDMIDDADLENGYWAQP